MKPFPGVPYCQFVGLTRSMFMVQPDGISISIEIRSFDSWYHPERFNKAVAAAKRVALWNPAIRRWVVIPNAGNIERVMAAFQEIGGHCTPQAVTLLEKAWQARFPVEVAA